MRFTLFLTLLFATAFCASAQVITKTTLSEQEISPVISDKTNKPQTQQTPATSPTPYVRPTAKKRFTRYVNGMIGPVSLATKAASAGISTWKNSPVEWGDRWPGFGRRFASNVGKSIIKGTVTYGLDEAFKLDSSYYRSQKKDPGSRIKNALLSAVTSRDKNGKRVFGFPHIAGTYTSSIVAAETWYPARFNYKNGLRSGTISIGLGAAFNIIKEFIPRKK